MYEHLQEELREVKEQNSTLTAVLEECMVAVATQRDKSKSAMICNENNKF